MRNIQEEPRAFQPYCGQLWLFLPWDLFYLAALHAQVTSGSLVGVVYIKAAQRLRKAP